MAQISRFVCLGGWLCAVSVAAAQEKDAPRLKVGLEVGKKIAPLFIVKKGGGVLLKNGTELTLLRGCDVELLPVADRSLFSGVTKDQKAPADLIRIQVQLAGEFPSMLAAEPAFAGPDGKKMGMHVPNSSFSFIGLGNGGNYESHLNFRDPPNADDWEKVRLRGLAQLDERLRQGLGESLEQLEHHDKPGWYLENRHPFAVSGKVEVLRHDANPKFVSFHLEPGAPRVFVDSGRFVVREVAIAAPAKPAAKKP